MRPIPGFDGYLVTGEGVVISRHGRPLAFYVDKDGYKRVTLAKERGKDAPRCHVGIHQAVCLAFHGPRPNGHVARHKDGSRTNNTPGNLAWSTIQENSNDRILHGTVPMGEHHRMAKLRNADIGDIRFYLAVDFTQREVADMYGVSQKTILNIAKERNWRHV